MAAGVASRGDSICAIGLVGVPSELDVVIWRLVDVGSVVVVRGGDALAVAAAEGRDCEVGHGPMVLVGHCDVREASRGFCRRNRNRRGSV